jgi:hypothetical protein
MQVVARLNRHVGVELPLRTLFEHPITAELALAVTQEQAEAEIDIEQMLAQVEQLQSHSIPQEMEHILAELEDTSDEERL